MNTVTLTLTNPPELYIEAETISPDHFAGKSSTEIAEIHAFVGNETLTLGDFFTIEGSAGKTAEETKIIVAGDLTKVKYIGMKMSAGEVEVRGSTDMYTGAWMSGGLLHVKGDVDSFCGLAMSGGELVIDGNAKNYLGASYRGDWRGMTGGKIVVGGNAGSDLADFMRGGEIIIGGDVDVHVATHAEGGKIVIKGNTKTRVGGQMVKGEIFVYGEIERMMPSFKYTGDEEIEVDGQTEKFQVWIGDLGERHGKRKGQVIYGKIYLKAVEEAESGVSTKRARRAKLTAEQKAELAEALKGKVSPSVQEVSMLIKEMFDIDMKSMHVSRLIDEINRL